MMRNRRRLKAQTME